MEEVTSEFPRACSDFLVNLIGLATGHLTKEKPILVAGIPCTSWLELVGSRPRRKVTNSSSKGVTPDSDVLFTGA